MNVHRAVVANSETESGISIHYVNENYDEGKLIFQARCPGIAMKPCMPSQATLHSSLRCGTSKQSLNPAMVV